MNPHYGGINSFISLVSEDTSTCLNKACTGSEWRVILPNSPKTNVPFVFDPDHLSSFEVNEGHKENRFRTLGKNMTMVFEDFDPSGPMWPICQATCPPVPV